MKIEIIKKNYEINILMTNDISMNNKIMAGNIT